MPGPARSATGHHTHSGLALLVLCCAAATDALDNGAARVPALGWSTWNAFGSNVSDAMVRESAAAIVSTGLAAAGYSYVNIDDGWACERDATSGELVPCSQFPNMTALGTHLHGLGLRFGLYTVWGKTTCASSAAREFHGSWGHVGFPSPPCSLPAFSSSGLSALIRGA